MLILTLLAGCLLDWVVPDCTTCEDGQLVHDLDADGRDVFDVVGRDGQMPTNLSVWPVRCDQGILDGGATGWFVERVEPTDYPLEAGVISGRMRQTVVIHSDVWQLDPGGLYEVEVFIGRGPNSARGLSSWNIFVQQGDPSLQSRSLEDLCAMVGPED